MNKTELITDFVCIATSGYTADNRQISAQDLQDMAETYDPEKYTAVMWFEHWRWRNFGRVVEVKAERDEKANVTKLYARIAPSLEMIEMNKAGQGLFTSIEITPNFANSGKAYLSGLAFTDSPASLGTTQLHFTKRIGNSDVFTGNQEHIDLTQITFAEQQDEEGQTLIEKFVAIGKKLFSATETEPQTQEPINNNNNEESKMTEEQFSKLIGAVNGLGEKIDKHFSTEPPKEPEQPAPKTEETKTETGVTTEQFNQLIAKLNGIEEKFNALSGEVTPVPNGVPQQQKEGQYNIDGYSFNFSKKG